MGLMMKEWTPFLLVTLVFMFVQAVICAEETTVAVVSTAPTSSTLLKTTSFSLASTCGPPPNCTETITCSSGLSPVLTSDLSRPCPYCVCRRICPAFDCITECNGGEYELITVNGCRKCSCFYVPPPPPPPPTPSPSPAPEPIPSPSPSPEQEPSPSPSPEPALPSPSPEVEPVPSPSPEPEPEVTVCPDIDCNVECGDNPYRIKEDGSCKSCECVTGEHFCANCTCSNTPIDKNVTVDRYIVKKNYVPYVVYFDPQTVDSVDAAFTTKFEANYGLKKQYNYLIFITKQTMNYRKTLINLRSVLQYLLTSGQITESNFYSFDQEVQNKLADLEQRIEDQSVTLAQLIQDTDEVKEIIKQLGFEKNAPPVCLLIGGQMECDLHPSYLNQVASSYLQDNIVVRVIYTKIPSKVTSLTKDLTTNTVTVTRLSTTWEIKTITVAQVVEDKIWEVALTQLLSVFENVRNAVSAVTGDVYSGDYENAAKSIVGDAEKNQLVQQELLTNYATVTVNSLRSALTDPTVLQLGTDNPPTVDTQVLPARETEEIIKLPSDILKLDNDILMDLLSQKIEYNY